MFYCVNQAGAINVLQENVTLRRQLNSLSAGQKKENRKNILYYKGRSAYTGIDRTTPSSYSPKNSSDRKNIYEKKGIKFKIDLEKQEQKLKEIQTQENEVKQKNVNVDNVIKEQLQPPKTTSKKQPNHNQDAE